MNNKFLIAGILLAGIVISGFVLSRTGRPFNGLLQAVHKLISLGTLIYLAVTLYRANRMAAFSPITIVVVSISAVFFIALFATGGIISAVKTPPAFVTLTHHVAPYVLAALTMGVLYLV
jgi:hypothetical protein